MASETKKADSPPYIAFSTFIKFINGLSETGIPSRIDKSLLGTMSGANQSALISTLKWFNLIDDVGAHGPQLEGFVNAGDERGVLLRAMLSEAYEFMADGSINLAKATGAQLEEKFRAYGLSGSTIVKAMAFFLSACKEAGIQVSAHIKLPKVSRVGKKKARGTSGNAIAVQEEEDDDNNENGASGIMKFEIPIPVDRKVKLSIPADFDEADWTLLQTMLTAYITRWKSFKGGGQS